MLVDCWVLLDDMGMRLNNQPELLVEPFSTPACINILQRNRDKDKNNIYYLKKKKKRSFLVCVIFQILLFQWIFISCPRCLMTLRR